MQFKFALIAATLLSVTLASPTANDFGLNVRDDQTDPLFGQGIVVSINGTTLTPEQTQTCVKSDCGDLLLHSACAIAKIALKDFKGVLKCFNLSTWDKVCPCIDCWDGLANLLHDNHICT